jgi:hypothetical protein
MTVSPLQWVHKNIPIAFHENNQNIATLVTTEQKEILGTTRKEGLTKKMIGESF